MKQKLAFITLGLLLSSAALARPEYVAFTGLVPANTPVPSSGPLCLTCHGTESGGGSWKPGVVDAYLKNGGIQGLIAFVKAGGAATTTSPDTAPVLSPIYARWDVTVGETPLVIPLHVSDLENDTFGLHGTVAMTGYTISSLYTDSITKLPTQDFKWTPTAAQANKSYALSLYMQENGVGRSLKSNTVTATVFVWPARANAATAKVQDFKLGSAVWTADNILTVYGQVTFKPNVSLAQRKKLLNTLKMQLKSNNGVAIGSPLKLKLNATGAWVQKLTLTSNQVPCVIKTNYEGLNVSREVKSAPLATCVK